MRRSSHGTRRPNPASFAAGPQNRARELLSLRKPPARFGTTGSSSDALLGRDAARSAASARIRMTARRRWVLVDFNSPATNARSTVIVRS